VSVTAVVDFGSSHTVTAVHVPGDAPRVVTVDGEPWLPSAVFLSRDDSLVVGPDAVRMAASDPGRLESRAKARIAEREVLLGDTVVPVVTIVRAVLARGVRAASAVAGAPVDHLVLTHPADWSAARLDGLLSAAQDLAPRISTIVEPVGAGAWFATRGQVGVDGAERLPLGAVLAVLDVGGGTTDVAVVRREASGIAVVGRSSIANLGGGDFDQRIVDHLRRTVPGLADRLVDAGATERVSLVRLRELVAFRRAVRRGKELLSRHEQVELGLPAGLPAVVLTRADLDAVLAPDLDRITAFTLRTILSTGVEAHELTALQLVGGSTRIPLLRRLLAEVIPTPIHIDDQPEAVVALGACAVAVSHAEPVVAPAPPERVSPAPARKPVVALVVAMVVAIAAAGYGLLRPAEVVSGGAAAASERFTLPKPVAGKEIVSQGAPSDGLVSGLVGSPVRMFDGVTDIDWTVNSVLDPATDELVAAGAPKPSPGERWVLVDASTRARDSVDAPFYLADTYLVDDRGLMISPVRDTPMPVACPTQAPAALFAGQVARQCLAFAVSVRTPVRAVVISTVSGGRQVGVTVPVDGHAQDAAPAIGPTLAPGEVRPLRADLRAAIVDVVTTPSAYVASSVVDRPGSRVVVVRAVVEADGEVSVSDLAARLVLRDDRLQAVPARLVSDRNGCAVGTASGRFVVCAVYVVPARLPLGSVAWSGDAARPFVWRLP
jgi:hypothetical protein